MDMTLDYIQHTLEADDANLSDIGSIVSLAILEAWPDRQQAINTLEHAQQSLLKIPIGEEARQVIEGALHHLKEWDQD